MRGKPGLFLTNVGKSQFLSIAGKTRMAKIQFGKS